MEIVGKLLKKTFVTDKGEALDYYVVQFPLNDEESIEVKIKSDKAKLLIMAEQLKEFN